MQKMLKTYNSSTKGEAMEREMLNDEIAQLSLWFLRIRVVNSAKHTESVVGQVLPVAGKGKSWWRYTLSEYAELQYFMQMHEEAVFLGFSSLRPKFL